MNDPVSTEEPLSLLIARALRRRRSLLALGAILSLVVSIVVPFCIMKPVYKSSIVFLPPTGGGESGLGSLLGGSGNRAISIGQPSDISANQIVAMFGTEALLEDVVQKLELDRHYGIAPGPLAKFKAKKRLNHLLNVSTEETGGFGTSDVVTIRLSAEDGSPDTAKMIVDEAFRFVDSSVIGIRVRKSAVERRFLQTRLDSAIVALKGVQDSLKAFLKKNQIVSADTKAEMGLSNEAFLERNILQKEAELNFTQKMSGSNSSDYELAKSELSALRRQLSELKDRGIQGGMGTRKTIDIGVVYMNLLREEEIATKIVAGLNEQVNLSALDEARNMTSLVVVDPSKPAEWKEKPKRIFVVGIILFAWNLLSVVLIAYLCLLKKIMKESSFLRVLMAADSE